MLMDVSEKLLGRLLVSDVYSISGEVLLSKGNVIDERAIERFSNAGVISVEVNLTKDEIAKETMYLVSREIIRAGDTQEIKHAIGFIYKSLRTNQSLLHQLGTINDYDEMTCEHCIRVAMAMGCVYKGLGKDSMKVEDAIIAGLLHDLGKVDVVKEILNAPRKLTDEEFAKVKKHPVMSLDRLKGKLQSAEIKNAILFHHINADGTGYPSIEDIDVKLSDMQKVLHIVDIVDARLHKRVYKGRERALDILRDLESVSGTIVNSQALEAVKRHMLIFYIGDKLVLRNGLLVQIENFEIPYRFDMPTLRVLNSSNCSIGGIKPGDIVHARQGFLNDILAQPDLGNVV